jgi:hypothetical protein
VIVGQQHALHDSRKPGQRILVKQVFGQFDPSAALLFR